MPHRDREPTVSIIIPVFNKLAFTRQCLDRIARHTADRITYETIVVDNASSDGTLEYFTGGDGQERPVRYIRCDENLGFAKANNLGAALSTSRYLLLLNNDTLVQAGWLDEMVAIAENDATVGIVGIKQLFPYTQRIHHTGIVFSGGGRPVHLYPHADASLPHVNKQRDYQAVNGACLLIPRLLYDECGGLDEGYRNGYEDVDLCMKAAQRGRRIVCCTRAFIYHYGQISDTRTADDQANAAYFVSKWKGRVKIDEGDFFRQDATDITRAAAVHVPKRGPTRLADSTVYLADSLSRGSALTWVNAELALALKEMGVSVHIGSGSLPAGMGGPARRTLDRMRLAEAPVGGVQIKWSHYWPQHLDLGLSGVVNLELFVINYLFARPGSQPWDYWLQCLPQNGYAKLPLSSFCLSVLGQLGVPARDCHVLHPGYSREINRTEGARRRSSDAFRFLTVTNSHDLERYGTARLIDAYHEAFAAQDPVVLVIKDYGVSAANTTLRDLLKHRSGRARVELVTEFTPKERLIALYRSCDAFVSAHRGEGFAMKLLDAMACGLPTITPLFGGPADYCTPSNCFAVDFTLAPMGDCLDSRSLSIGNSPTWAEPDLGSLVRQLRAVYENPVAAKATGERARQDVIGRFTWDQTARTLISIVERIRDTTTPSPHAVPSTSSRAPEEQSPYWLGVRVSVVIPTFNRKGQLLRCLDALARQSILPQEFEVLVVDDGSTDGTAEAVAAQTFSFRLRLHRQANQGPGAARNAAVAIAEGELVLFIDDDILADERLLEGHLLAHATRPEATDAVLGHVDWPPLIQPNAVMQYVCGHGNQQFAYSHIPNLPSLDFRFFYTSNVSVKRRFLVDAATVGIRFDPGFRYAAYEDSEMAYRLARMGLRISYAAAARAYHDHWMDVDSFSIREFKVGQMAVVFYRKHPQLDALVDVRWIGEWSGRVERLVTNPSLLEKLKNIDAQTDAELLALARGLNDELAIDKPAELRGAAPDPQTLASLHRVLGTIFDIQRTRGKVQEWYASVDDGHLIDAARVIIGVSRKLQRLNTPWPERSGKDTIVPLRQRDVGVGLRESVQTLEQEMGTSLIPALRRATLTGTRIRSLIRMAVLQRTVFTTLRSADAYFVERLRQRNESSLALYLRMRNRLWRRLF